MLNIINKNCLCIEESIKTVHFNKSLPEYNNIFITNMKDTIAYIFDGTKFILTSKDEVINDLYNSHLENIEQFLEEAEIPFIIIKKYFFIIIKAIMLNKKFIFYLTKYQKINTVK